MTRCRSAFSHRGQRPLSVALLGGAVVVGSLATGVLFATGAYAESALQAPPTDRSIYDRDPRSLTKKERWKIRLHGLRVAALDPNVWAMRRIDRTDNRRLIPIRPYYLRASEDPTFRLTEILMTLRFDSASSHNIEQAPATHSPVFEIGFGGKFVMGLPGERPAEDSGYAVRLSASPLVQNGLVYHSHANSVLLQEGSPETTIEAGQAYRLRLTVGAREAVLYVNEKPYFRYRSTGEQELQAGLVSLVGDWLPVTVTDLTVRGERLINGVRENFSESGLVSLEQ
ncbi:MAG: hypothetical protein KDD69_13025 [Bdellovibrionales bacterium]|nr:hypothetical protein [Bdellovibrionales bacterium]